MSASTFVLYHANCADGFGAAWAASRSLVPDVVYVPMQYGDPYPPEIEGGVRAVYMLDFSMSRETILKIVRSFTPRVVVLDHHKSAAEALAGLDGAEDGLTVRFDMDKSGAVLAWEHFHPDEPVPLMLQLVQDRDLWRWELDDSREYSAALSVEPRTFERWSEIDAFSREFPPSPGMAPNCFPSAWFDFIDRGSAILDATKAHVSSLADKAMMTDVGGWVVPAVNSPLFQSEIGDDLCRRYPNATFAAVFFVKGDVNPDGHASTWMDSADEVWSLRSRNGFDVSEVAKALGGGGHAAAAGFVRKRGA